MPPPIPPSFVERISCPVFAIRWLAGAEFDTLAYGGGGGSARTGVGNSIVVRLLGSDTTPTTTNTNNTPNEHKIDTGNQICVSLDLVHYDDGTPFFPVRLLAAVGTEVQVYDPVLGTLVGRCDFSRSDGINAVCWGGRSGGQWCAVGCENGGVMVVDVVGRGGTNQLRLVPRHVCDGHTAHATKRGVCAVDVSWNNNNDRELVLSSAREGTARVWDAHTGQELATLRCAIGDAGGRAVPTPPPQQGKRPPPPVLVRGCAFGTNDGGTTFFTCQSGRKGPAWCSKWKLVNFATVPPLDDDNNHNTTTPFEYRELIRVNVSPRPVSSVSMSGDGSILVFGNVDGSIALRRTTDSLSRAAPYAGFVEVHDLPVTCLAARPYQSAAPSHIAVVSCSADNKLAFLSTRRPPRSTYSLVWHLMVCGVAILIGRVWYEQCRENIVGWWQVNNSSSNNNNNNDNNDGGRVVVEGGNGIDSVTECLTGSLYVSSSSSDRPGISFVPH